MFETIDTLQIVNQAADRTVAETAYRTPELRSAGSAVKLVQGASYAFGYDCYYGAYDPDVC